MKERFRPSPIRESNIFVLSSEEHLESLSEEGVVPLPQLYVDLWQLGAEARRFVLELEEEFKRRSIRGLEEVVSEGESG